MQYAILAYVKHGDGHTELWTSVAAGQTHYDGLGYLQPEVMGKLLDQLAASIGKYKWSKSVTGFVIVHPSTEYHPTREEAWSFDTFARQQMPSIGRHTLADGRTMLVTSYRKLAPVDISL